MLSEFSRSDGAVELGEFLILLFQKEQMVSVDGVGVTKERLYLPLSRSGEGEVPATNDSIHTRFAIVHHGGQVVSDNSIPSQGDGVSLLSGRVLVPLGATLILDGD